MKRTITLTAEDLQFMNGMSTNRIGELFLDVHERLKGYDITPRAGDEGVWKKLDSLTSPVKTAALGTSEVCQICADRLNGLLGTKFRPNAQSMKTHVSARLREGYGQEDFLAVIDKKVAEWKGTDMEKFIRPETLFGPKFEGYLNQSVSNSKGPQTAETQKGIDYSEGL